MNLFDALCCGARRPQTTAPLVGLNVRPAIIPVPVVPDLPEQLPPRRITLTPSPSPKIGLQSKSSLLSLPAEIRDAIWKECLGPSNTFHLAFHTPSNSTTTSPRLRIRICLVPTEPQICRERNTCWSHWEWKNDEYGLPIGHILPKHYLLSLPLTCRQTYRETTHYLYTLNTFDSQSPSYIHLLHSSLSPARLNSITNLRFSWMIMIQPPIMLPDYQGDFLDRDKRDHWLKTWSAIADMRGLQYLYVDLKVSNLWSTFSEEAEIALVEPIRKVRVERFELLLPYSREEERSKTWEGLPCQIRWGNPMGQ